ncbi:Nar1p [Dipodascopsis tothii]|uniref:Nar1p n=1 Tax=Dipodascopsis tothii TaxID=44089 RepID=UPI0034CF44B2
MSAILSEQDLNDFITPGLACINPVAVQKDASAGEVEIQIGANGQPMEVSLDGTQGKQLTAAQINLSDCLACSGCITSAESVLVSMQSHVELLNAIAANKAKDATDDTRKVFAVSMAHQCRASLAAAYGLPLAAVDAKLGTLFRDVLGFEYVVGMETGRQISLAECATEVVERQAAAAKKPVLASACPGWICYVEKTHPHIIPYLSAVKSPQQITGSLLKKLVAEQRGVGRERVYHVSIMPCFDKKLEASREEFTVDGVRDVDCVITTKEIVQLLNQEGVDFATLPELASFTAARADLAPAGWPADDWDSNEGSSSGGYLHHVLGALQQQHADATLEIVAGRNGDMVEYNVVAGGAVVARAAQVYGFRNIQNLVRKLKPAKAGRAKVVSRRAKADTVDYDYVEVMACPGGCINGGGQIEAADATAQKEWRNRVEEVYFQMARSHVTAAGAHALVAALWGEPASLTRTTYRAVEKKELTGAAAAVTIGSAW